MSDNIKFVIEIPKKVVDECQEVYATQKCYGVKASKFETMIANGKPLSEVLAELKTEIQKMYRGAEFMNEFSGGYNSAINEVLVILNSIGKEDKE